MDVYVILTADGKFLGISARLQGAELIRAEYQKTNPDQTFTIRNVNLSDWEDSA